MTDTARVLQLVAHERAAQQEKWGEQNHPNIAKRLTSGNATAAEVAAFYGISTAAEAKALTDDRARHGMVTWADILIEELAEAIEAAALYEQKLNAYDVPGAVDAHKMMVTELVQVAAVAVQWAEKLGDA